MGSCSTCGTEFAVRLCPNCGAAPAVTSRKINQALVKYSYPMLGGLLGIVIANGCFPLLDRDPFLIAGLCAIFAPAVLHVVSCFRKRLPLDFGRLQRAYLYAGAVTVFLALLIACNGALDQSPVKPVRATVVRKQVTLGRYGRPSYTLSVRSWRTGRATEDFDVNGRTYRNTSLEKAVVVEVHRGRFGLPWCSGVLSE
jgi:hypothetical protein